MTTDTDTLVARLRNPTFGTESSERNLMAAAADRIAEQQDNIHDTESGPWPRWAASILACLKDFGWRFDDLIDLPEELANYLREYPDSAVEGLQEHVADLTAQLTEARAGEDELAAHIKKMQSYVQEYLEPGPYVSKHGKIETFSEPHKHQSEGYAFVMRTQMQGALLGDLIHMLDGPEERIALASHAKRKEGR